MLAVRETIESVRQDGDGFYRFCAAEAVHANYVLWTPLCCRLRSILLTAARAETRLQGSPQTNSHVQQTGFAMMYALSVS